MSKYKIRNEHSSDKYIIGGVAMALVIIGLLTVWLTSSNSQLDNGFDPVVSSSTISNGTTTIDVPDPVPGDSKSVVLAKCLAQKNITMYGAAWCSHCQDQKRAFGTAWQYVPYVECPDNVQLCISKRIEGYPTWQKPDGTKIEGAYSLNKLADWAGCSF